MNTDATPIRVMMTKLGLDGHDRGVKIVARVLRDAGIDVIYAGLHRSPEEVVTAAIQEDVDVLGISLLSGAHMPLFGKVMDLLKEKGALHITVVGGGLMPDEDVAKLKEMGVAAIMRQDSTPEQIVATIRRAAAERSDA
jgi:methylmalonyl-CoA mutase C-terminal domain/subunit